MTASWTNAVSDRLQDMQVDIDRRRKLHRELQATAATIRQNLFLAFVYNGVSVPLAAFGFISPMWASAAMSLSSVSVILNSLRLRRRKL